MTKNTTYSAPYKCRNCGWSGRILFNRGEEAPVKKTCPNCDCFEAEKTLSTVPVMPMPRPAPRPIPMEPVYPRIPWPTPFPRYKDPWWNEDPRPWRRNIPYCFAVVGGED